MFARKKAAELMGMDEAQLSKAIQKREIIQKIGAEDLMNLSADKFEGALKDLEAKVAADPTRKALFDDLLKATDQRTTAERSEDLLEQIQSNTKLTASGGIDIGALQDTLVNELKLTGKGTLNALITTLDRDMELVGEVTNIGKLANAMKTPLQELVKLIPGFGDQISTAIDNLTKVITASKILSTVGTTDALIMPDRGPILKPAKNDVIAAFRPGDVIDKTIKSSGGGTGIDYSKLASAIASAMSNVKVEATVKADTLYAATKLNGPRRFGQG
jgi:hypothetical protein